MSGRAEQAKQAGNAAFKAGDLQLALAHYSTAIQLDPSVATYPLNRALVLLRLGNPKDAERDATTALELEGGQGAKALFRRALARKALGKLELARDDFLEAKRQGAGDDVDNELSALVKQLEAGGKGEGAKKVNGAAKPAPSSAPAVTTNSASPSTERLRAALASPSPSSSSPPAKPTADGLMTAVSSRRLTPSASTSTPPPPASAPAPTSRPAVSFAAKKEARAAKQQQPPRQAPTSVAAEESDASAKAATLAPLIPTATPIPEPSSPAPSAPRAAPVARPAPPTVSRGEPAHAPTPTPSVPPPAASAPPVSATALETHFLLTPPGTPSRLAALRALDPDPASLRTFFGPAGVPPDLLSALLTEVVPVALADPDKEGWVARLLRGLTRTVRWESAAMFLDEAEREGVRRVFETEEERWREARAAWGV